MIHNGVDWYVSRNGRQYGPFSRKRLDELRSREELSASDMVWREGWSEWQPLAQIAAQSGQDSAQMKAAARARWTPLLVAAIIGLIGALGGGVLSNWHTFFPRRNVSSVESCDESLGTSGISGRFSGVYAGLVKDDQSQTDVELKLVRNGNSVLGAYFRQGLCGKVFGEVAEDRMHFQWTWAGATGRGIAIQEGTKLIARSGFGEAADGGGALVFFRRDQEKAASAMGR